MIQITDLEQIFYPFIKGEKGEKGDKGDKGDKGEQGEKGEKGENGSSVTQEQLSAIKLEIKSEIKLETLKEENPIGHIRMETTNTNPADYLGFGTWTLWGAGRVPVGVDTTLTEFATVEKTGGEKTHTLSVEEMPTHKHGTGNTYIVGTGSTATLALSTTNSTSAGALITDNAGGGQAHNNLQPYITCYMWKRTE